MLRHILMISTGTFASRLLGYLRDSMIAALLGAGPVADAFLVAFQFINVARRSLTEGALNAAFIPGYLRTREIEGEEAAAAYAGRVLGSVSVLLIGIALVLCALMPSFVSVLAPGFVGHQALHLAVTDARLMMPYFAFVGPATVMMGVLNAQHRFTLTAVSPVLFNVTLIAVIGGLLLWPRDPMTSATVIAGAVGVAGSMQMLILISRKFFGDCDVSPVRVSLDAQTRGFFRKGVPGMIANAGPQFLIVAAAIIASSTPSAVSWLYFANRLIELPLGIVGVAMGTVLMPELTRAVQGSDRSSLLQAESRALELAAGLSLPAMLGLIVLGPFVVQLLFEHGSFTANDTRATAQALAWLGTGLPAHVLVKVLAPTFFARDDTRTPLIATLCGIAAAIVCGLLVGRLFGVSGVAASISAGAWTTTAILIWRGASTFGFSIDDTARKRLPRIVACAAIMGATLYTSQYFVAPVMETATFFARLTILGGMVAAGISLYGLLLDLFNVVSWGEAFDDLRDRSPRGK
ncbi:MAG: murein biosynthesis integral membrane protein MurJ [Xanthobacteraceae bacterium]|nr:murein biosynthesis integral membrane protein MurJ [Xanthobacteraceae bacterium]